MSLINAYEVRYYSPAGPNFDVNVFNRIIETRERYTANKCLGWTFYDKLVTDLNSYSGQDWNNSDTYSTADIRNDSSTGLVYRALQNVPASIPLSDTNYWELAPKFATAAYNSLWGGGLRDYLAISVYRAALTPATFKGTSQGVTRHVGSNEEAATKDELSYTVSALKDMETEAYSNLVDYLKRNNVALGWTSCDEDSNCKAKRNKNLGFVFYD